MNKFYENQNQIKFAGSGKIYVIIGALIGCLIGSFLVFFFQGQFPLEVLAGGILGAFILLLVEIFTTGNKNMFIPETDERVSQNIFSFFSNLSHITLAILILSLTAFSLLGESSIPISYLWIFFFLYILVGAIGGLIVKRK